ncbi:MAG TPA: LEA type 2 family protein [Longimicrobiaceae bacterium]|nr:LEA type 2 family protein [Longimicrobiaceae bacterium]
MTALRRSPLLLLFLLLPGCATLGQIIQPPRFEVARDRQAELRLLGPSASRPLGGAAVRLWARVQNPNPLGLTLSTLAGGLLLEGRQAARVDFPLGVPLQPGQETVIPIEVGISFADVPELAGVLTRAITGAPINYQLDGTVGVDAGPLGQPTFGPMTLLRGDVRVTR